MRALVLAPLVVFAAACGPEGVPTTDDTGGDDDSFSVVVIPDTQIYAERSPEVLKRHIRWIADHVDEHGIVFASHVGDIVNYANAPEQWAAAVEAYQALEDIGLPHGFSVGGHDFSARGGTFDRPFDRTCSNFEDSVGNHVHDCDFTDFKEHFGPQVYEGRDWWVGASPSGRSSAQRVSTPAFDLLFVHLPQDTPEAEVAWAEEVLDAHPDALAQITTHRYLFDYRLTDALPSPLDLITSGRFNDVTYLLGGQKLVFKTSLTANELFERLIEPRPNIWSVHCGHVDAEFRQEAVNARGLTVHEVLVDFQDMADGGGGWLRLLTFHPSEDRVEVFTVSTETGELRENGDGFEHSLEILESYRGSAEAELQKLGFDTTEADAFFEELKAEGEFRDLYYDSLYGEGWRDSRFVLDVPFSEHLR